MQSQDTMQTGEATQSNASLSKKPMSKADKKKEEEARKAAEEARIAKEKEHQAFLEKIEQEKMEAFKNRNRVKLEFLHAFGNYTGTEDYDIEGQVTLINDEIGVFNHALTPKGNQQLSTIDPGAATQNTTKPVNDPVFSHLQLIYPVGRHITFKSLHSNQMKFIKLPKDAKEVTSIALNNSKTLIAVAARVWEFDQYDKQHLNVYFYTIEQKQFKRMRDYTIRATRGGAGQEEMPLTYVEKIEKKNNNGPIKVPFQRYIQSMTFSKDDKQFAFCVRNGPSQCHVLSYDLQIGKRMSTGLFNQVVSQIQFLPRDPSKLMISGEDIFHFYRKDTKKMVAEPDFDGIKTKFCYESNVMSRQNFKSFCFLENDHIIGCSNIGDLFVIEFMQVVQHIDPQSLIKKGTQMNNRTEFKKVLANRFGFVAVTDDLLYFFQFKPSKSKNAGCKGTYHCVLKWRAPEFKETKITSVSIQEGANKEDSNMAIGTKGNQIIYLNIYKQVYYPDHLKLVHEMKNKGTNKDEEDTPLESDEEDFEQNGLINDAKIKSIGIEEEQSNDTKVMTRMNSTIDKKEQARKESQALIDQVKYDIVAQGFHQGEISSMDICIQRPIIATMSKADSTIRVWNYDSGECELSKSYHSLQREFQNSNQTYLQSLALHPSGFYMAIGFIDKVKVYHLMQSEIREYRSLDIKNCHTMKFSNGGQLLACCDYKDLHVFNTYTLDRYIDKKETKLPSNAVNNIDFNWNDTLVIVCTKDGFIQKYDLEKPHIKADLIIEKNVCSFNACIFSEFKDKDTDEMKEYFFTVGSVKTKTYHKNRNLVRLYDVALQNIEHLQNDEADLMVDCPYGSTRFTNIIDIQGPLKHVNMETYDKTKRARNLVMSNDVGRIYIYGIHPNLHRDKEVDVMNAHHGSVTCLKKSVDDSIVVSAGHDGTLFIYKVVETQNNKIGKWSEKVQETKEKHERRAKQLAREQQTKKADQPVVENEEAAEAGEQAQAKPNEEEFSESEASEEEMSEAALNRQYFEELHKVIDKRLSNIVLIDKLQMEDWRKEQEQLKLDMEKENSTVESNLSRKKYAYDEKIRRMESAKTEILNRLNEEYETLQHKEAEEKDENTQTMKKMELNHMDCKEELESLYEKKLQMEKHQFDQLSQAKEEQQQEFETEIKELQKLNEQAIESLLNHFKDQLQDIQQEYDKSKKTADGLKMIYEEKLTQNDDDDQMEMREIKRTSQEDIDRLEKVINTIKDDIETIKREANRENEEMLMKKQITENAIKKKMRIEETLNFKKEEIQTLEREKQEIQKQLKEKEKELYKQKFKIEELQNTQQVLTHRTQEMKASLEPKEQQIEDLKEQLKDLEKVFEKQLKATENLEQDVEKRKLKIKEMQNKLLQEKNRTKEYEDEIARFVSLIHKAFTSKDENKYIQELMIIYEQFVSKPRRITYIGEGKDRKKIEKPLPSRTEQILENKKKDPETIEELGRQLQYMEKSINTLKQSTQRNQAKTRMGIKKRREDNDKLIRTLENTRSKKKQLEAELNQKQLEIQKLKLEKQKRQREFDKKLLVIEHDAMNQVKKQAQKSAAGLDKSDQMTEQNASSQVYKRLNKDIGDFYAGEQGVASKVKGKLYKGTPFIRGNAEDKLKISELENQIEENNQQILLQKLEKRSLQEQIIRLLDERADDLGLTEDQKREQLGKLNMNTYQASGQDQNQTFGGNNTTNLRHQNDDYDQNLDIVNN